VFEELILRGKGGTDKEGNILSKQKTGEGERNGGPSGLEKVDKRSGARTKGRRNGAKQVSSHWGVDMRQGGGVQQVF